MNYLNLIKEFIKILHEIDNMFLMQVSKQHFL